MTLSRSAYHIFYFYILFSGTGQKRKRSEGECVYEENSSSNSVRTGGPFTGGGTQGLRQIVCMN